MSLLKYEHEDSAQLPQILCLGLPRTGTTSMFEALKILGFKCSDTSLRSYHMSSAVDAKLITIHGHEQWSLALEAKFGKNQTGRRKLFEKEDWERLLRGCDAVTDFPASTFAAELIAAFPNAKVIFTTRDINNWHNSVQIVLIPMTTSRAFSILHYLDPGLLGHWVPMLRAFLDAIFQSNFQENGDRIFVEHERMVRDLVPSEQLLVFEPKEGWKPLCKFLGRTVPDVVFPRVNDTEYYLAKIRQAKVDGFRRVGKSFGRYMVLILSVLGALYMWIGY